ncbi:MAG: hypothetical protein ACIAQF_14215 [Phycisphaerales bacterium JB065]
MTTPADIHRAGPFCPDFRSTEPKPALSISDYDALADLFLGEGESPDSDRADDTNSDGADSEPVRTFAPSPPAPVTDRTTIEAVIVGHLPVRASLWVMQHARLTADSLNQTVAVLRTFGDEVAIDLLSPGNGRRSFNTVDARSLDDALATASSAANHWIITSDELSEPDLISHEGVDSVSLLTSAARSATVAAYRTLKHALSSPDPTSERTFRFVVLGSEPEDADRAAAQLRAVSEAFMDLQVEVVTGPRHIDATRSVPIYRGRLSEDAPSAIELIRKSEQLASVKPKTERSVKATREPDSIETSKSTESQILRLCSHLENLTDLPLTCPIEPQVQLALDDEGRIHILATGDAPDPVRSLTQAGAWASLNRELILAAAQRTDAEQTEPVLHLLVDDVPANRRLLDAPIRVHLLRSIPTNQGEPVWFSTPLN